MFSSRKLLFIAFLLFSISNASAQVHFYSGGRKCTANTEIERSLLEAVNDDNEAMVRQLLRAGADAKMTDDCGIPVLSYAIVASRPGIVEVLISAGAEVNSVGRSIYKVPLANAIQRSDWERRYTIAKLLIDAGADVNKGHYGTPLMESVSQEDVRLVELLVASGADVNFKGSESRSAYSIAANLGHQKLKSILLKAGADPAVGVAKYQNNWGEHAFFQAAADGRVDVIEAMLDRGLATANMSNSQKVTALMRAHEVIIVEALLRAGADVNLRDSRGYTALMWAAEVGHASIVKKLITAGTDVNVRGNDGKAAIDITGNDEIKKMLTEAGAEQKKPSM
jgi:ankyrin repeat protein